MQIFLVVAPGLETCLAEECRAQGFDVTQTQPGGVTIQGTWADVWRANRDLRGVTKVLVRLAAFRALHLAQLDKRARKLPWSDWLPKGGTLRVEAVCRQSRIYHDKAATQRIADAARDALDATISADAPLTLKARIEDDLCTLSLDTSGDSLHKRGLKQQVNKAPMRETLASLFLRSAGFDGSRTVYDPMCGSGTFPIEAAEIALNLAPGRARSFAFQDLPSFDAAQMPALPEPHQTNLRFFGSDRDAGAIRMSAANAERSGVGDITEFTCKPISDITPPEGAPGLIIVNPPYGGRVGNKKPLFALYGAFGAVLKERFKGWQVALITSEAGLAKATALTFSPPGPVVNHGGIKIRMWQTRL